METKIFKTDAKQIVDMAFNNKLFKDSITRDDMNGFEELIQFLLESKFESYKRVQSLIDRIEKAKS